MTKRDMAYNLTHCVTYLGSGRLVLEWLQYPRWSREETDSLLSDTDSEGVLPRYDPASLEYSEPPSQSAWEGKEGGGGHEGRSGGESSPSPS